MSENQEADEFLSPEDLCKRWGVRENYLCKQRHFGNGPKYIKIGGIIKYRKDHVRAFEDAQSRTVTSKRKPVANSEAA